MTLKERIIDYTDCPGCGHELDDHNELAGCLYIRTDQHDFTKTISCVCILNQNDIAYLREWWQDNPRVIND